MNDIRNKWIIDGRLNFDTPLMHVVGWILGSVFLVGWLYTMWLGWGSVIRSWCCA